MYITRQLFKFLDLLREENRPSNFAAGVVMGMFLGLTPMFTLQWVIYFLLVLVLKVNLAAVVLSTLFFMPVAFLAAPLFHPIGLALLSHPHLQRFWAYCFHAPVFPYTEFSNTVVMGVFLVSLIIAFPLYFVINHIIVKYGPRLWYTVKISLFGRVWITSRVYRTYVEDRTRS